LHRGMIQYLYYTQQVHFQNNIKSQKVQSKRSIPQVTRSQNARQIIHVEFLRHPNAAKCL